MMRRCVCVMMMMMMMMMELELEFKRRWTEHLRESGRGERVMGIRCVREEEEGGREGGRLTITQN